MLDFSPIDAVGFIPMYFSSLHGAIGIDYARQPLALQPPALSVLGYQAPEIPDSVVDSYSLNPFNPADDGEISHSKGSCEFYGERRKVECKGTTMAPRSALSAIAVGRHVPGHQEARASVMNASLIQIAA